MKRGVRNKTAEKRLKSVIFKLLVLSYKSQCQNSSKFLSSQYFMKTTYQIVI